MKHATSDLTTVETTQDITPNPLTANRHEAPTPDPEDRSIL